jgi:hypothetical protein
VLFAHITKGSNNMNEILQLLTQKFGLDEKQAKDILNGIVDVLTSKLPPPLNEKVDALLDGKLQLQDLLQGVDVGALLGGLAGGKDGQPAQDGGKDDGFGLDDVARGLGGMLGNANAADDPAKK